jgi:hypothetical protein
MAVGRRKLRYIRFGKEVTPGTSVTTTTYWRGAGTIQDDTEVTEVEEEDIGIIGGTDRSYIGSKAASLALDKIPATFEQLQYLFAMGFGGPTTGSADGVGTDKIYTTTIPSTSLPTAAPYTVIGGDNFENETMEYTLCRKIELEGTRKKAVTMAGELFGRQATGSNGVLPSISRPTVEDILTQKCKVYLDAIGGTFGGTLVSTSVIGFKLKFEIMWSVRWSIDGNLYFATAQYAGHKISGDLTFEHNSAAAGYSSGAKVDWRAGTASKLQILMEGNAVATPGTSYSVKTAIINLPIKWKKFSKLEEDDGIDTLTGSFFSKYNATAASAGQIIVVNELAALT